MLTASKIYLLTETLFYIINVTIYEYAFQLIYKDDSLVVLCVLLLYKIFCIL